MPGESDPRPEIPAPPIFVRLHHVTLTIPLDGALAARRFYGEVLELEPAPRSEAIRSRGDLWYRVGAVALSLQPDESEESVIARRHIAFEVDDVVRLRRRLELFGVEINDGPPVEGCERFYCRDPFGHRLEFIQVLSGP